MKVQNELLSAVVWVAIVTTPVISFAQHHDLTHDQDPVESAIVQFGVNPSPSVPLGPPPCLQLLTTPVPNTPNPAIGGPTDPCSYLNHHLNHDTEVTIFKGGQVQFNAGGGGHSFAIYEVSKDTTRADIGEDLCLGFDRGATPLAESGQPCNLSTSNAASNHIVSDGKGDIVIESDVNPPNNLVSYEPGRLASASAFANVTSITYRFLKAGRYLVLCRNRTHFLNDWMFSFVNVIGGGDS